MNAQLEPPIWENGPMICPAANLPAFKSKAGLAKFKADNCPGTVTIATWLCNACGLLHYWGAGHDPSGQSSGTTRTGKRIAEAKAKFLASTTAKTIAKLL